MARVSNYKFISSKGCIINSRCNCVVCALYDNSQNILTNRLCFFITISCILFYIFELADVYTYTLNIYTITKYDDILTEHVLIVLLDQIHCEVLFGLL